MNTFWTVILILLAVVVVALVVLYFVGRKIESRQAESKQAIEAAKQTVTMLVIDKKRLKLKEAGLPKIVYEQTPRYLRWAKVPIVKAKVGPKVMTLMADEKVFPQIPVKQEVRAVVSGMYIMEVKGVRGGSLPQVPKKKGFFGRLFHKDQKKEAIPVQTGKKAKK